MRRAGEAVRGRFSREAVLAVVDQYCRDKYTFFYLPYDQKTGCNLGYGYIDMVDLASVAALYEAVGVRGGREGQLNGKTWQNTRSVKVCMICYGRLQSGEVVLVERREPQQDLAEYCSDWSVMSSEEKYHPLFFREVTCVVDGKEVKKMERYTPPVVLKVKNEE